MDEQEKEEIKNSKDKEKTTQKLKENGVISKQGKTDQKSKKQNFLKSKQTKLK